MGEERTTEHFTQRVERLLAYLFVFANQRWHLGHLFCDVLFSVMATRKANRVSYHRLFQRARPSVEARDRENVCVCVWCGVYTRIQERKRESSREREKEREREKIWQTTRATKKHTRPAAREKTRTARNHPSTPPPPTFELADVRACALWECEQTIPNERAAPSARFPRLRWRPAFRVPPHRPTQAHVPAAAGTWDSPRPTPVQCGVHYSGQPRTYEARPRVCATPPAPTAA
jgi:hypothetical protein